MTGPAASAVRRDLPGAASLAVREALSREPAPAAVLAAFPSVVYLGPASCRRGGRREVVALTAHDGVRLPNAVVVPVLAASGPFARVAAGDPALVGGGLLRVGAGRGALRVAARRWWSPSVTPRESTPADVARGLGRLGGTVGSEPGPVVQALSAAAADGDAAGTLRLAVDLLGRGPGLTPEGDDVLTGFLVTLHAFGVATGPLGRELLARAHDRTTALSATLLGHAARGEALAELRDVLDAVRGLGEVVPAAARLLRVGHSSGRGMAHGVLAAGRAVLARRPEAAR